MDQVAFILFKAVHDDDLPRVQATLADEPAAAAADARRCCCC
jgi:hypothetical protein